MKLLITLIFIFSLLFEGYSQKYLLEQDVTKDTSIPKFGFNRKFEGANYLGYAMAVGGYTNSPPSKINNLNSWQFRVGLWGRIKLTKWYALGGYVEYARDEYRIKTPLIKDSLNNLKTLWTKQVNNNLVLGIYNRLSFNGDKILFDFGAYYAFDCLPRIITKVKPINGDYNYKRTIYNRPSIMNRSNYGIDIRFTYKSIAFYSRYRITNLYKDKNYDVPKYMFGLAVDLKD